MALNYSMLQLLLKEIVQLSLPLVAALINIFRNGKNVVDAPAEPVCVVDATNNDQKYLLFV